jgi:hypothetical protein
MIQLRKAKMSFSELTTPIVPQRQWKCERQTAIPHAPPTLPHPTPGLQGPDGKSAYHFMLSAVHSYLSLA